MSDDNAARAFNLVTDLAARVDGQPLDKKARDVLTKKVPRGALTWDSHLEDVPGLDPVLITAPHSSILTTSELSTLAVIAASAYMGFFRAATVGHEFATANEVASRFGSSTDDNYGDAGESFLKFARTYWSYRLVRERSIDADCQTLACHIVRWLESSIGPLFFPIGPTTVPVERRRADQRQFLELFAGREMDIDGFLAGSPILKAEQRSQHRGAFGLLKFLLLCFMLGALVFVLTRVI